MARVILLFTFCCQLENDMESLLGKSSVEELQTYPDTLACQYRVFYVYTRSVLARTAPRGSTILLTQKP